MFLFDAFPKNYLARSLLYSLLWSCPYAGANAAMLLLYARTDAVVPRIYAIATSGFVFLLYFLVVFVLRKGERARVFVRKNACSRGF